MNFIYPKSPFDIDAINKLIQNSKTVKVPNLFIVKLCYNFDFGEFIFILKNEKKEEFKIPFYYNIKDLNLFWKFLETAVYTEKAIYLDIINSYDETFLYLEPLNKFYFRFVVMGSKCTNFNTEISNFGYFINLDVTIKKKEFIKQFYTKITEVMAKYEVIAYFEPPLIDYNYWIKNSEIISKYLKGKNAPK